MAKKKKQRGGKRPGSGRPTKHGEPTVKKSITIPKSLFEWAVSEGKPLSQVVVEALEESRKRG